MGLPVLETIKYVRVSLHAADLMKAAEVVYWTSDGRGSDSIADMHRKAIGESLNKILAIYGLKALPINADDLTEQEQVTDVAAAPRRFFAGSPVEAPSDV